MYLIFEAHPSDDSSLGVPLGSYASLKNADEACSLTSECVGIKFLHTADSLPWRTFKGTLWEGVTGKLRVQGDNINPWMPGPSAD